MCNKWLLIGNQMERNEKGELRKKKKYQLISPHKMSIVHFKLYFALTYPHIYIKTTCNYFWTLWSKFDHQTKERSCCVFCTWLHIRKNPLYASWTRFHSFENIQWKQVAFNYCVFYKDSSYNRSVQKAPCITSRTQKPIHISVLRAHHTYLYIRASPIYHWLTSQFKSVSVCRSHFSSYYDCNHQKNRI